MYQRIEKKFVKHLSITSPFNNTENNTKILRITDCTSTNDAVKLLLSKAFQDSFDHDGFTFVVVVEVDGDLGDLSLLDVCYDVQKPMIISFESTTNDSKNSIWIKEANEKNFKPIILQNGDSFNRNAEEDVNNILFSLEILLQMLYNDIGGKFNGKLLETSINMQQKTSAGMRFIDRAVYSNNILCIKFLRLFQDAFDLGEVVNESRNLLKIASRSCDLQGFLALLDLPFNCDMRVFMQSLESLEILHPQNPDHLNLLMIASESGNVEAVNFLRKCSYDINQQKDLSETAASLAWKKENFDVFVRLLEENSLFPDNFHEKLKQQKERGKVKNVLTFISDINSLHESIKRGRMDQVKAFLIKNPSARYAYNIKNESAAAMALKSEQFAIYEFLISQGVCLGPHEDLCEILNKQAPNCRDGRRIMMKKMYLHEMHKKYFKKPFDKHLMDLLSQSDVGFDTPDDEKRSYFRYIKEAFQILNEIEEISLVLKIVAKSKFFRIIFDFHRDSVGNVDPTTNAKTRGTSYFKSGYIYVGAKGLLSEISKYEVLGTLAHEMTHYAMQLVYENNCKPYRNFDCDRFNEFSVVSRVCEFHKEKETKIFYTFNYPEAQQHAELIVRVPHLLALYKENPKDLERCQSIYEELFTFYRKYVMADLQTEHQLMMPKRETIELNDWFNVVKPLVESNITLNVDMLHLNLNANDKILLVISNCVRLTIKALHQQLTRDTRTKVESLYLFARPSALENCKMKALLLKAFNLPTKPTVVFQCEDDASPEEIKVIAATMNATSKIIFIVKSVDGRFDQEDFHKVHITHSWMDLPELTRNVLWAFNVNFQGAVLCLKDLLTFPSKPYENIPFCDLLRLKMKVSEPLKFKDVDFFVERKVSSQSQQDFDFDALSDYAVAHKIVLLSDDPGAGKTTTFKRFALQLKEKFPSYWVTYLDLKQFIDVFELNEFLVFSDASEIAQFIAVKMLRLENVDLSVFCQLFIEHRLILLLDGIDEICPNFKDFIVRLLKAVKSKTNNQLWISTRPHIANDLSRNLGQEYFYLKPFTQCEQREFYFKFYEHRQVEVFDMNRYLSGIENLMGFLSQNRLFWSPITSDISTNPLFMRIVADIYDDDVMYQSRTGKCMTLCNLYLMYERFMERKFNLWILNKGRLSISDQIEIHRGSESIVRCHLRIALEKTFNDSKVKMLVEESKLKTDQIVRVGLMTQNGSELQFIHRTFAEFFVSDFLFSEIFCPEQQHGRKRRSVREQKTIMRLFVRVLSSDEFQMIRAFLGNAIELVKHKKDVKRFRKMAKSFRKSSKRLDRDKMLTVAVSDGCINLTSLLLQFSVANQNAIMKLILREKRDLNNVLINSFNIHRMNIETIKTLWDAAKNIYSSKDVKSFLMKSNGFGKTLLHISARYESSELLKFLLTEIKLVTEDSELHELLTRQDCDGEIALTIASKNNANEGSFKVIWKFYEEIFTEIEQRSFLAMMVDSEFVTFRTIIENNELVFQELWKSFMMKFSNDELKKFLIKSDETDILHFAAIWKSEKMFRSLFMMMKDVFSADELNQFLDISNDNETILDAGNFEDIKSSVARKIVAHLEAPRFQSQLCNDRIELR